MAEEKITLPIHSALIPTFYQSFHCLAQDCRDNCCVDWNITFDKKDYLRLRRLDAPPALRERLEKWVRREKKGDRDGTFYGKFDLMANHLRCPFLDEDGLCAIQRACGHDALPKVCTTYPRSVEYTVAAKEYTLDPACEGVLQLLWDLPEGIEFVEDPLPKTEQMNANFTKDKNLLLYFAPVREACIDILQNRAIPLSERMLCLGVMIQRLLKEDWKDFDLDGWEQQAAMLLESDSVAEMDIPGDWYRFVVQNLSVLKMIDVAHKSWPDEIYKALEVKWGIASGAGENNPVGIQGNFSLNAYAEALVQFKTAFSDYEYFFENLMVAVALHIHFPLLDSKESLWKSYVSLCNLYSFYRFASVAGCKDDCTKEQLFHMIVMASRATMHSIIYGDFQEQLFKQGASSLAYMAILLRWDRI